MTQLNPPPVEEVPPVLTADAPDAEPIHAGDPVLYGLFAEYETVDEVFDAAEIVRDSDVTTTNWDVHSPFPLHGIDDIVQPGQRTVLPYIVMLCAITGFTAGYCLTMWTMSGNVGFDAIGLGWVTAPIADADNNINLPNPWGYSFKPYEYLISGKPFTSLPAYIPPIFELTILLSAFGAVFGMFLLNALPKHHHPLLKRDDFRRVTDDRFYIVIENRDPDTFDADAAETLLRSTGAAKVARVYE